MIVEEREYQIRPGNRDEFWENYQSIGLPIQRRFLPCPLGFFFVELGAANNFVHMWGYNNLSHRDQCRSLLHECTEWREYVKVSHQYILGINIRILRALPEDFSKLSSIASALSDRSTTVDTQDRPGNPRGFR